MVTITDYYRCKYCGKIISVVHSSDENITGLLLCPYCGRNIFGD